MSIVGEQSLAIHGRKRVELNKGLKKYAATPLLLSIRLFACLRQPPPPSIQMSARWTELSFLFRSIDKLQLEAVSIMATLREIDVEYFQSKPMDEQDDIEFHLIEFLCGKCHGNVPHHGLGKNDCDNSTKESLVARLVAIFGMVSINHVFAFNEDFKTKAMDVSILVEGILGDLTNAQSLKDYLERRLDANFSLPNLCSLLIWEGGTSLWFQGFLTSMMVLQRMAKQLRTARIGDDGHEDRKRLREYREFGQATANYLERSGNPNARSLAVALFYVGLSSSFISLESIVEPDSWNWKRFNQQDQTSKFHEDAVEFAKMALDRLSKEEQEIHKFVHEMIAFYLLRLESNRSMKVVQDHQNLPQLALLCHNVLKRDFADFTTTEKFLVKSVVSFLVYFSEWLFYRGDYMESLHISSLNLQLGRHFSLRSSFELLESRVLSHVNPNVAIPNEMNETHERERKFTFGSDDDWLHIETSTYRIRRNILAAKDHEDLTLCQSDLDQLMLLAGQSTMKNKNWTVANVYLRMADVCQGGGDFVGALAFVRKALMLFRTSGGKRTNVSVYMLCSRELECLQRMAMLYSDVGDRRKAHVYALQCTKHLDLRWKSIDHGSECQLTTQRELEVQRLLLQLETRKTSVRRAGPEENVNDEDPGSDNSWRGDFLDLKLQDVLRAFDCMKPYECSILRSNLWLDALEKAKASFERYMENKNVKALTHVMPAKIAPFPCHELLVNEAKACFSEHGVCEKSKQDTVEKLCTKVCQEPDFSDSSRAEAWYLLGLLELGKARESGALYHLWNGRSNLPNVQQQTDETLVDSYIGRAQRYLRSALTFCGPASTILTRNVLRSLVLVTGPGTDDNEQSWTSHSMLQISIGASHRMHVSKSLRKEEGTRYPAEPNLTVADTFQLFDTPFSSSEHFSNVETFFSHLTKRCPSTWRFVSACLCPTGEMIVSSWNSNDGTNKGVATLGCIFPCLDEYGDSGRIYESLLSPLDSIIHRSQEHVKETKDSAPSSREEVAQWWRTRREIDQTLQVLLESTETDFFGHAHVQDIVFGDEHHESSGTEGIDSASINLSTKFAILAEEDDDLLPGLRTNDEHPSTSREELELFKVAELKEKLRDLGWTTKELRNVKKNDLIDLLISSYEERYQEECNDDFSVCEKSNTKQKATILVLDEHLQRFPFESLPSFEGQEICRIPCLSFALAKLCEIETDHAALSINPDRISYVLDPESNLPATRERIDKALHSLPAFKRSMWDGIVGERPSRDFMVEGLSQNNGLFLYYGHGGTQDFFSSSELQRMLEQDESGVSRRLRSAVVLMGCSSGRLESVIKEGHCRLEEQFLTYLPEGMALSYLAAGAPSVVGNLWDVTDVDIDRFAIKSLELFLEEDDDDSKSLAQCVALARSACKLRYLTGSAPVCYGLPIHRM